MSNKYPYNKQVLFSRVQLTLKWVQDILNIEEAIGSGKTFNDYICSVNKTTEIRARIKNNFIFEDTILPDDLDLIVGSVNSVLEQLNLSKRVCWNLNEIEICDA